MFTIKPTVEQTEPPLSPRETLPTMYDLPSEDPEEPGLPDEFHDFQPDLLRKTFRPPNYPSEKVFSACDLNLYYDVNHTRWYKRPDWFGVAGLSRFYDGEELRLSYVIWQEVVHPLVVVELLSPGTENEDLGQTKRHPNEPPTKWEVYEKILRIPYYVVFDRYTDRLKMFTLQADHYQELALTEPRVWLPEIELGLGLWQGEYEGVNRLWLRWYDAKGNWILTDAEDAQKQLDTTQKQLDVAQEQLDLAQQEAEMERQRAEEAEKRAAYLAQKLRELGIEA